MGPPPNSLNHSADSTGRASSSTQLENSHAEDSNLIVTSSMPDSDDIEEPGNVHCQLICHSEGQAQARVEKNTQVPVGTRLCPCTPYQTPELQNATCTPRSSKYVSPPHHQVHHPHPGPPPNPLTPTITHLPRSHSFSMKVQATRVHAATCLSQGDRGFGSLGGRVMSHCQCPAAWCTLHTPPPTHTHTHMHPAEVCPGCLRHSFESAVVAGTRRRVAAAPPPPGPRPC